MNHIRLIAALLFFMHFTSFSQTAPPADLATIEQGFEKLSVLGSVLYVAAHPDDENTRLLAYLAQEKHYRTGYLSLTRGDGGQNLIGNEQGELLGLIRTQELLAARKVDGAEQFFTRANDFGFSKGPDETLRIWDKEKVLSDVVWVIRKFRPDVIICRFPTTGEGGHGHHTSSAILAQEAFTAAADPKRYPEQLKYVQTWQAKRLLWNTFNFGGNNTTAPDQFKIDVGVYNSIIGKGYGELAAESRSNHKTQGFGSARQRGESFEYFKTILGDAPKTDLMDGVNTTWGRIKGGGGIIGGIDKIKRSFEINKPQNSVKPMIALFDLMQQTSDEYWKEQKQKELKDLIVACTGLWFEAYTSDAVFAEGDPMEIHAQVVNHYGMKISLEELTVIKHRDHTGVTSDFIEPVAHYHLPITGKDKYLRSNELQTFNYDDVANYVSQPYWLQSPHSIGTYEIDNEANAGNPENPGAPIMEFAFLIERHLFSFNRKVVYKYVNPAKGEIYQPVIIAPPVTANIVNQNYIFNSMQPQSVQIKMKSFTKSNGTISMGPVTGWKVSPEKIDFSGKNKGDEWTVSFTVAPADKQPRKSVLKADVIANGKSFSVGFKQIAYEHIPTITLFPPAEAKLLNIDLKLAGKKIGYLPGAGDFVQDALKQIGYDVHQLTESEILNSDLSGYDAIVTGVRAFNVNARLAVEEPKLLDYVKNGGNLVLQYNNFNGLVTNQIGPYPFRIVNQRVTDEDAKIIVLDKTNPILNYPNSITQDDFTGWVQERGLYLVTDIDPNYRAVLQMNDPGEAPSNGALIEGNYGKGRFVYTSLAFFRQLPAGVPGAYRLFVNLLSKPKNTVSN